MPKLTIHTATYNRAYILEKAYESLKCQTVKDFEWIITDDGSTDETDKLVESWVKKDNGFTIMYNKLSHVGIPRALNSGISLAKSHWFMMLDSDDYLLPNTVELVIKWLDEIENIEDMGGIGFAKCYPDGSYMKPQMPIVNKELGYIDATNIQRKEYNLNMDMCEVHRTELFRKYPFKYWGEEMYAPEQLNYNEIALAGWKLRWRAEKLYVCDYLPDGQTRNNRLVKNNPMGFAMMHNQNMLLQKEFKKNYLSAMQMVALTFYAKHLEYLKCSNNKWMTVLAFPLGIVLGMRRKAQFAKL